MDILRRIAMEQRISAYYCSPVTTGASSATYYSDYAYIVNTPIIRAVRFGGHVLNGSRWGPLLLVFYAPSYAPWAYGGGLYFLQ